MTETLAEELARLVSEYDDQITEEAWNLIADFAYTNADKICRALSADLALITAVRDSQSRMRQRAEKAESDCLHWAADYEERGKVLAAEKLLRQKAEAALAEAQREIDRRASLFDAGGNYLPYSQISGDLRAAEARIAELEAVIETAYGALWRDHSRSGASKSIDARKTLLATLSKEGQKRGIEQAIQKYGPTTEQEVIDDAL